MAVAALDSIRVLHVDDDPAFSDLTAKCIERNDDRMTVETATTVSEGLDRLDRAEFDCVVSDLEMPDQSGIDFLKAVRRDSPDFPFILFTGKGSEEIASEAISAGVSDYLQKQSGIEQYSILTNRICNLVSQHQAQAGLKRSQAEARENEERLNLALEASEVGLWELDFKSMDSPIRSQKHDEIFGYDSPLDEWSFETALEHVHPEDREYVEQRFEEALEDGVWDFECRIIRADGEERWIAAQGKLFYNDSDEPTRGIGLIEDITERRTREQEVARLNELHETILANIRDTVLLTDDTGKLTYVCPNVEFIFGYDTGEVTEFGTIDALLGEWLVEPEELEEQGEIHNIETAVADKEGQQHELLITVTAVDMEEGCCLYSIRDITDRKARERELQSKSRRLDAILDNTKTPMYMKADDGEYLFVNRGYRELFGLEDEEIVGRTDHDIHPPEMADDVTDNDQFVIDRGEALETEEYIIVDGNERIFLTTKVPIYAIGERSDPNRPVAVFGVASDITERKASEQELQRERDRLDEFSSALSHDLRNPLQVADGNLKLAIEDRDLEALDAVAHALGRMDTLIEDMLALANAGDSVGETERIELDALADACWQNVGTASAAFDIDTDSSIRADKSRLQQLLENLLRNAIEHGGEDVTVTMGDLPDGFYVEDDGPGIPPEERDKVLDAGYSTRENGTGFGLNIVCDIAEAHGWNISVTEGSGGGARFEFSVTG